jgi:hypothetical protein
MNTTSKKAQFSYLDEDAMSSASALTGSATKVPTQQSVKAYVDTTAEGLHVLEACTLATTADLNYVYANGTDGVGATLTNGSTGVISIDGTALTVNIRILVKDQAGGDNDQNGIYKVTTAGAVDVALVLTREPDFDTYISSYEGDAADIRLGDFVFISSGAVNIGHGFVMTGNSKFKKLGDGVVGTDSIEFTQFSGLSETVAVNQGGTGATSLTTDGVLFGNGTSAISAVDLSTNGNVIVGGSTPAAVTGANLAGAGLSATVGNGTLVLNGEDASTSAKGIASFSSDNFAVSSGAVTIKNAGISLTAEVTGTLAVGNGGTGLSSIADNSILHTTSSNTLAALTAPSADRALMYDHSATSIKWVTLETVCFLKGTKITLPDNSQKNIEDLSIGELVLTYQIDNLSNLKKDKKHDIMNWSQDSMEGTFNQSKIRNMWVNPTDRYLVINDKLRITNLHIIHVKRDNEYKFLPAEKAQTGDLLFTDKDEYEPIQTIEQVNDRTEVYNIGLQKHRTYFAENYLVHHLCETCSGLSGRI